MASTPQTITLSLVFDYEYQSGDPTASMAKPAVREIIRLTLFTNQGVNTSPVVNLVPRTIEVTTDANGYWQAYVDPASALSPGSYWLVETQSRRFRITGAAGQASQNLAV